MLSCESESSSAHACCQGCGRRLLDLPALAPIIVPVLPFLLEIGTEELPPSFQLPAVTELSRRVAGLFSEHELATGESEFFYTPRRLAVRVSSVAEEKPAQEVELQGPPKKAAFDAQGKPTRTALGFARAHGQDPSALYVKLAGKGEYVFVRKTAPPVKTADVLMNELPGLLALPSPRAGRWQDDKTRFPRPVRWLLCLLGDEVIPFEFGGLVAGNTTFGHRNFTPGPIVVPNPATYEEVLLRHKVVSSPAQRRAMVESALKARAAEVNGVPLGDSDLLEETVNITEHPEPILCSFSPDYLSLPAPLLITALKMHQRCFSVSSPAGVLLSHFIAVANTPGCDHAQVRMWYEKAVDSRLRDARFFYEADLKLGLEPLVEEEKKVVWIEEMGTLYDKTQRLRRLCAHLTSAVPGTDAQALDRAALLCKTDLLTQVVREKEFTSLQGIMGGIYAERAGEPPSVAAAISEHYLPRSPDDDLPRTLPGALLSIADKTDNIVATFLTGNVPTGSEDPFALRRQATGLLTIILELKLPVDVQKLTETA
ncbi:glycine--tRNA ligase subunit beta, partial [candidate division WOR-3 bacterium]|nr:glycine--tRNA ligase subunit beta [candidate division WOR-3 bacterium]